MDLNKRVRSYWEKEPCGTSQTITGPTEEYSFEYFDKVERHRYEIEPYIHSSAQFTRHHGKKILEVGVGAGTDHLQWARAGAECFGVDLTDAAILTTKKRLEMHNLSSELKRIDAEQLPYDDNTFDVVYSWGVIHHSQNPELIISEIHRVLKKSGLFIGMMYGRRSLRVIKLWIKHSLLAGKPWRSARDVIWNHVESIGTKAYSLSELNNLFRQFSTVEATPLLTKYDTDKIPKFIHRFFPDDWGWFITLNASK
ncbi:MAG: Phthiotriol/phenolphthiotriol dimycocerosates methyltransferase [Chlamydiae bacterium]|nr:Phthiotriol/phenolphthiotriol dimycocerosates methyltransferase [Chlamydiota bacterium]